MESTMQDTELLVSELLRRGAQVFPDAQVLHYQAQNTPPGASPS
jgi:hypothetical protein